MGELRLNLALPWTAVVAVQIDWPLALLALLATLVTGFLLVSLVRGPSRARRRFGPRAPRAASCSGRRAPGGARGTRARRRRAGGDPQPARADARDPERDHRGDGARGGRLLQDGEEVGWVGDLNGTPGVEFDLSAGDETTRMKLVLHPPKGGFGEETTKLAEWLSSQAAIALENARLHDVVQWQAITDELTGLVNRRRFLDALRSEITKGQRLGGRLSVVLADLDDFKLINDGFGHHAGDEVLLEFADLLRAHGRDVDVAARLGGEEFAILLPETGSRGRERRSRAPAPVARRPPHPASARGR